MSFHQEFCCGSALISSRYPIFYWWVQFFCLYVWQFSFLKLLKSRSFIILLFSLFILSPPTRLKNLCHLSSIRFTLKWFVFVPKWWCVVEIFFNRRLQKYFSLLLYCYCYLATLTFKISIWEWCHIGYTLVNSKWQLW